MQQLNWSIRIPEGATLLGGYNRPISVRFADGALVHYTPKALASQDRFELAPKISWLETAKEIVNAPDYLETGYISTPRRGPPTDILRLVRGL